MAGILEQKSENGEQSVSALSIELVHQSSPVFVFLPINSLRGVSWSFLRTCPRELKLFPWLFISGSACRSTINTDYPSAISIKPSELERQHEFWGDMSCVPMTPTEHRIRGGDFGKGSMWLLDWVLKNRILFSANFFTCNFYENSAWNGYAVGSGLSSLF